MIYKKGEYSMEIIEDVYVITDDKTKIDLNSVHSLLKQSHWAKNRPLENCKNN